MAQKQWHLKLFWCPRQEKTMAVHFRNYKLKGFKFVYWISFYLAQSLQIYRVQEINFFPLKISKTKLPHVHASIQNGHTTAHQLYFWKTTLNLKTLWYSQMLLFITNWRRNVRIISFNFTHLSFGFNVAMLNRKWRTNNPKQCTTVVSGYSQVHVI